MTNPNASTDIILPLATAAESTVAKASAPAASETNTVAAEPIKQGYRTTEFWLSTVVTLLGIALASGAVPEGGLSAQIVGGVLSVLASLGYTASRTQVKKG